MQGTLFPRTIKNRPIWSNWLQSQIKEEVNCVVILPLKLVFSGQSISGRGGKSRSKNVAKVVLTWKVMLSKIAKSQIKFGLIKAENVFTKNLTNLGSLLQKSKFESHWSLQFMRFKPITQKVKVGIPSVNFLGTYG